MSVAPIGKVENVAIARPIVNDGRLHDAAAAERATHIRRLDKGRLL